jgi:uncharacterized protein
MALAPETWSALAEDERTKIFIAPFVGFFDLGYLAPHEVPVDIDDRLDDDAALIPRMILVLRKLARVREAARRPAPLSRRSKVGRNDPCPCDSGKNTNAVAPAPDPSILKNSGIKRAAYDSTHDSILGSPGRARG